MVELGCRTRNTAIPLLYAAQQFGGYVYNIDIEKWSELEAFSKDYDQLVTNWTFIESDNLKLEWNKPIDFLYIDTSHIYDHTLKELQKYEPLVTLGGIIIFHDISMNEVSQAISDYFVDRKDIEYIRYFNNNGLGIIIKN